MAFFDMPILAILVLFGLRSVASASYFLDYDGKPVINGGRYYISRHFPLPDESSITWANSSKSQACPLYVIQTYFPFITTASASASVKQLVHDDSITILSQSNSKYIPRNATFQIYYNDKNTPCKKPLKWSVKPAIKPLNAFYLVAGYDYPGYKGSFKIIPGDFPDIDNAYRLVYCFNNREPCLQVGNAPEFPKGVFGISNSKDPDSVNFYSLLEFQLSK